MNEILKAYVEIRTDQRGHYWDVIVCPFCGGRHSHGPFPHGLDKNLFLGTRVPHCTVYDVVGMKSDGEYELIEADADLAAQLHKIAAIKPRFLVVGKDDHLYARCRNSQTAMKAAERTPLMRQPVLIINRHLMALKQLQEICESKMEIPWHAPNERFADGYSCRAWSRM